MLRAPCTSAGMATLAQLMHIACSGSTGWKSRESWESGRRKWVAKSDRKEPLPLPPNDGCSASAIIECTKCPYSRSDFSSFSPFSCSFSSFFLDDEREDGKTGGRWFKCQLTKGIRVENLQEKNSPHIIISHTRGQPKPNPSFAVPVPNE